MENNQDQIVKMFREGLSGHEMPVGDGVWAGIQSSLAAKSGAAATSTGMLKAASFIGISSVVAIGAFNETQLIQSQQTPVASTQVEEYSAPEKTEEATAVVTEETWSQLETIKEESAVDQNRQSNVNSETAQALVAADNSEKISEEGVDVAANDAPANSPRSTETADHNSQMAIADNNSKIESTDKPADKPAEETNDKSEEPKKSENEPVEEEEELVCSLNMIHEAKDYISPDGDGTNECFEAKGATEASMFKITIWTRSGELLFESTDPNFKWCGTDKFGNLVENRTMCYYKIEAFDENHILYKQPNAMGSVQVFR